eukprot:9844198-Prorocentrum_lima.AAC.1
MTSSLVGSEMCIRDRLLGSSFVRRPRTLRSRCGGWPRAHLGRLRWPSAVSYTHLTLPTICSV